MPLWCHWKSSLLLPLKMSVLSETCLAMLSLPSESLLQTRILPLLWVSSEPCASIRTLVASFRGRLRRPTCGCTRWAQLAIQVVLERAVLLKRLFLQVQETECDAVDRGLELLLELLRGLAHCGVDAFEPLDALRGRL